MAVKSDKMFLLNFYCLFLLVLLAALMELKFLTPLSLHPRFLLKACLKSRTVCLTFICLQINSVSPQQLWGQGLLLLGVSHI